jgi:hypothetical protein
VSHKYSPSQLPYADDFEVIWRGLPIGRIMRPSGVPHDEQQWTGNAYLHGRPSRGNESGTDDDLADCKAQFREAWARIRAGITDADIARANQYAEASAEALARYDRKRGNAPLV